MVRNLYLGVIVLLLHGCFNKNTGPSKNAQNKFIIVTGTKGMNNGSALTIDVVQVYEEYIWNQIIKLKAEDYFKKRDSVLKKNANIWTINVVEDFWARPFLLKGYQDRCIGTMLFTTYQDKVNNIDRINKVKLKDKFDCTSLQLGQFEILEAESATFVVTDYTIVDPR